jgi:hypothetical protein
VIASGQRRVWLNALDGWTALLRRAPGDEVAQRWQERCVKRLAALAKKPEASAERAAEGFAALVKCARLLSKQPRAGDAALKAWEQVLLEQDDHAEAHAARCRCLAEASRWPELPAVAQAARPYLPAALLWRLARLATHQERWQEALDLWRLVADAPAADAPLASVVAAQMRCALRLGLEQYRPALPAVPANVADRTGNVRLRNVSPRHVVITGVSYCGSTLLGLVLGALPGVANVGESHWLVEKRRTRSSEQLPTSAEGFEQCMSCGPDCAIVTDALRRRLADRETDFHATLGADYGAEVIVSSDKYPHHVVRLDPRLCNDTVVLFRHPMANWHSHCARHAAFASPKGQRRYFRNWADVYTVLLRYFANTGAKIVLNFEDFAAAPGTMLPRLCGRLSLPYDPDALCYWRKMQHFVGGNIALAVRLRSRDEETLTIRPPPGDPHRPPAAEAQDEFVRALAVWESLKQAQAQTMGA